MLIDPRGKLIGIHEGEFSLEEMDAALGRIIAEGDRSGQFDRRPLSFTAAHENEPDRPLFFPGKVLADAAGKRLFVADTGHHRIVELSLDGRVRQDIRRRAGLRGWRPAVSAASTGRRGWPWSASGCTSPIRTIMPSGASTCRMPWSLPWRARESRRTATTAAARREVPLSSPWDVAAHRGRLYVAMAGLHQIWEVEPLDRADALGRQRPREHRRWPR